MQQTRYDRSFIVFLGLMVVVAAVTVIAFVIFGAPDVMVPGAPE